VKKRVRERSAEEIAARKKKKEDKRAAGAALVMEARIGRPALSVVELSMAVQRARIAPKERRVQQHLSIVRSIENSFSSDDAELEMAAASFSRAQCAAPWPPVLRPLQRAAALDSLHWELWAAFLRDGQPSQGMRSESSGSPLGATVEHPATLAKAATAVAAAGQPGSAKVLRRALGHAPRVATRSWGLRKAWLLGRSQRMWLRGSNSLLRLLRARWCEAACSVAEGCEGAGLRGRPLDPEMRVALFHWHLASRESAACHLSFAVPSARALRALSAFAGEDGLVELGADNGYWASLLRSCSRVLRGSNLLALDIKPPPQASGVVYGTAASLPNLPQRTLLICMPSPGEVGLAEVALACFGGDRLAYVGEWGTGLTATRKFHSQLLRDFELECQMKLPCWAFTRVELFLFRRRLLPASSSAAAASTPVTCDACGARQGRATMLWSCPWTRQLRVCGEACFKAAKAKHNAVLAACFCGAYVRERPAFETWAPSVWQDKTVISEQLWSALREETLGK